VRNFVPLMCIAFLPAASPLHRTLLHGFGGACKWAMLGKYTFNSFCRGFIDVFLWGVLCATLPTWDKSTGAFTGYFTLLTYVAFAAAIEASVRPSHGFSLCSGSLCIALSSTPDLFSLTHKLDSQIVHVTLSNQILDGLAALHHECKDSTPVSSKCAAESILFYVLHSFAPDTRPLLQTAPSAASWSLSPSASCTCPRVTLPMPSMPFPLFWFLNSKLSLRRCCPHAAGIFSHSSYGNLRCSQPQPSTTPLTSSSAFQNFTYSSNPS
jgi:hypothetical protein